MAKGILRVRLRPGDRFVSQAGEMYTLVERDPAGWKEWVVRYNDSNTFRYSHAELVQAIFAGRLIPAQLRVREGL